MAARQANRPPPQSENALLAALPADDFNRVAANLLAISALKARQIVHQPLEPIDQVFFPTDGFFSVLAVLENGNMVEVATVGREGMVGMPGALTKRPSPSATMVQAEIGLCYSMGAAAFREEMQRHGAFYDLITSYEQALVGFVMQSTACNAAHTVEQRLARWLLLAHDRVGKDDFALTQEFAAMMLGASRSTVTLVAQTLQKAGLITYHRGHLTIVNRKRLETAACECYRTSTSLLTEVTNPRRSSRVK